MSQNVYGNATRLASGGPTSSLTSRSVSIYMAGDVAHAKQVIRKFCREMPSCVTVVEAAYLYTGGEEAGFVVTFRAYPRFPESAGLLATKASFLADRLRDELGQRSYMIDDGVTTSWFSGEKA